MLSYSVFLMNQLYIALLEIIIIIFFFNGMLERGYVDVNRSYSVPTEPDSPSSSKCEVTSLQCAAQYGHCSVCEYLIDVCKVDLDVQDNHSGYQSALILACEGGHIDIALMLIKSGANTDINRYITPDSYSYLAHVV